MDSFIRTSGSAGGGVLGTGFDPDWAKTAVGSRSSRSAEAIRLGGRRSNGIANVLEEWLY
jgi:hypothetical protein